jgi:prepilin signal peptidase PulO-like enzyme (type II secretory pathway)
METSTNPELPVEWATPAAMLIFLAFIVAAAAMITLLLCRRQLARRNKPSYWVGLIASLINALLITLLSYETNSEDMASKLSGAAIPFLLFAIVSLIPSLSVVRMQRRRVGHGDQASPSTATPSS